MTHRFPFALLLLASLIVSSAAVAQEPAEPTEAQVKLYTKATEAFAEDQFPEAIELLKSALALGELNALYLNLGRAYFRNGQCDEADAAYGKALTAPAMAQPSPSAVRAKVEQYRGDMKEGCPGTVVLTCNPPEMRVRVGGGEDQPCGTLTLAPGKHVIRGTLMNQSGETTVEVTSRGTTEATLSVEMVVAAEPDPEPAPSPGIGWATWGTLGAGVAIVGGAFVLDFTLAGPAIDDFEKGVIAESSNVDSLRDDAESAQNTVLIVGGVGAAVLATGAVLLVLDLTAGPDADAEEASVGFGPGSVTFTTRW